MTRLRNVVINAGVVLGAAALIAIVLEFAVMPILDDGMQYDLEMWKYAREVKRVVADPELGHAHKPNAKATLMGVEVTTNSLGLRNAEIAPAKRSGSKRILMLGDSITFGWGVASNATVSRRLEDTLRRGGSDVEVINTGVGNYNTRMEVQYFLTTGHKLDPDLVILNYFINDAEPIPTYDNNLLDRNSRAYVYFSARWDSAMRKIGGGPLTEWKTYYRGLYDDHVNPGGWRGVEQAIERLASYCEAHRIKLMIVNYPELRQLAPYPFAEVSDRLRFWAAQLRLDYLDLLDGVRHEPPSSLWVTVPDPHPNARANELFAATLAGPVAELLAKGNRSANGRPKGASHRL